MKPLLKVWIFLQNASKVFIHPKYKSVVYIYYISVIIVLKFFMLIINVYCK